MGCGRGNSDVGDASSRVCDGVGCCYSQRDH